MTSSTRPRRRATAGVVRLDILVLPTICWHSIPPLRRRREKARIAVRRLLRAKAGAADLLVIGPIAVRGAIRLHRRRAKLASVAARPQVVRAKECHAKGGRDSRRLPRATGMIVAVHPRVVRAMAAPINPLLPAKVRTVVRHHPATIADLVGLPEVDPVSRHLRWAENSVPNAVTVRRVPGVDLVRLPVDSYSRVLPAISISIPPVMTKRWRHLH